MIAGARLRGAMRRLASVEGRYLRVRRLLPPAARRALRRAMREPSPRRYIPAALGVGGFFEELRRRRVAYVVLRWFELLPEIAPGEDIDLLVADEDLPAMAALLDGEAGLVPCDVYTVSGMPGTDYRRMAYYPPDMARGILMRGVLVNGLYRSPCPEDHFLSLAYHALYHKGTDSGLPSATPGVVPISAPEHDYAASLAGLAATLRWDVGITMEALDEALAKRGWRPPPSSLERLAEHNIWVCRHLLGQPLRRVYSKP
jgi:hypothetical protein